MAESCTGKADSGGKMNYKNVKIAEGARIAKQSVILGNVTAVYYIMRCSAEMMLR